MSLRPTLARTLLRPQHRVIVPAGSRGIGSTPPRRAGAGAGHEEHHGQQEDDSTHTHESFLSPPWRNTLILITASVLIYPYLPSPQKYSASPSVSPDKFSSTSTSSDAPWITRQLAKYTPESKVWTDRNDKHLELSKEKAEERLLFQEAERPKVHRMRYPSHFEQASPHCLPVGGSIDLSDLQVKRT